MSFRPVFLSCALIAFATATFNESAQDAAFADTVSTAATINKMEEAVVARVCQAASLGPGALSATASKLKNMSYGVRCFSVSTQLFSCISLANETSALLDMERAGQKTFAELKNEIDNASGSGAMNAIYALSLAETAPSGVSPDQLALAIYKQCSSYVVIH